jgi:hypothetical protein
MRLGLGPVFAYEWLTMTRRWQVYAVRSLFVGALLAGVGVVWWGEIAGRTLSTTSAQAEAGQSIFAAVVGTQLALVLLVAPAATAGAVCLDKARGALTHLLGDGPVRRRDRPGQAGRPAGPGPGARSAARCRSRPSARCSGASTRWR